MKAYTITKYTPHIQSNGIDIEVQTPLDRTTHPTEVHGMFNDFGVGGYEFWMEYGDWL